MKLKTKIITGGAALAFLTFAASGLQAQITNILTITATADAQQAATDHAVTNIDITETSHHDVTNTTITDYTEVAAPAKVTFDTKQILDTVAEDEYTNGTWTATNFPAGAKLAVIEGGDITNEFVVLNKTNEVLVIVTNIISLVKGTNDVDVVSGKEYEKNKNNAGFTGSVLDPSEIDLHLYDFKFDDTAIVGGSNIKFNLLGLDTETTTDTTPVASGTDAGDYTETVTTSVTSAVGEGSYKGRSVVLSDSSITGTGTVELNIGE